MLRKLLKSSSGATAIEYAVLAAMFSVIVLSAYTLVGDENAAVYERVSSSIGGALTKK